MFDKKTLSERDICTKFITPAIEAMKTASGDGGFHVQLSQQIQKSWAEFIRKKRTDEVLQALRGVLGDETTTAG